MAIEFFTGFEGCATAGDVRALFDSENIYLNPSVNGTGFNGSKALADAGAGNNDDYVGKNVTPTKTISMGMHIYSAFSSTSYQTSRYLMQFIGPNVRLNNTSGGIRIYVNDVLLDTVGSELSTTWNHIEAKLFSNASSGTLQIKVNGTEICSLTGVNTGGADITQCRWCRGGQQSGRFDNLYIADDLQGEIYSYLLKPSSDVAVQFTPSAGTDNFALIDEDDGDTGYVYSDTVGHKDLYGYEDLPLNLEPLAVSVVTNARKDGTGGRILQSISKQDAVEYNDSEEITLQTDYPNGTSNQSIVKVRDLAPDGTAWTREKVNAMQFGFKITG